jgi:hypothetical protein
MHPLDQIQVLSGAAFLSADRSHLPPSVSRDSSPLLCCAPDGSGVPGFAPILKQLAPSEDSPWRYGAETPEDWVARVWDPAWDAPVSKFLLTLKV